MRNDERVHAINNKRDVDNKPISEERHWWFVIFFRSTVQMTSDEMNKKKQTCSFYFLWSQVMTHLYSLLFYIRLLFILRYSVGFQLTQKYIQYIKQTSCTQIYHLVCLNLFIFVGFCSVFFLSFFFGWLIINLFTLLIWWSCELTCCWRWCLSEVISTFIIWIQLCVCVCRWTHMHALSNCSVSSVAKKTLPSLHLSDSRAHTHQCKREHKKKRKRGDSNAKYNY